MPRPGDPHAKIKLLTAAEAEFVEKGLDRTKVEDITARAGLSKGAFYLHFQGKDDAFRQLVETMVARLARFIDAIGPDEAETVVPFADLDMFLNFWFEKDREVFEFVWQNRGLMGLLLGGGSSRDYRYLMDEFAERTRASIATSLELGIKHGIYREDLDVELASLFLAGGYDRFARQLVLLPKKPDFTTVLRKFQQMAVRSIASARLLAHCDSRVSETARRRKPRGPAPASSQPGR